MSIYLGTSELDNVYVGSQKADSVYIGSELVWPTAPELVPYSVYTSFSTQSSFDTTLPRRGFDYRSTGTNNPGWLFNGMLVAGDNSTPTYWALATQNQYNGAGSRVSLRLGDALNTKTNPASLVFATDLALTKTYMLDIGSNGIVLRLLDNGTTSTLNVTNMTLRAEDEIAVERRDDGRFRFSWGNNSILWTPAAGDNPGAADGYGYVGLMMYSSAGQWCSRVTEFAASGTGYPEVGTMSSFGGSLPVTSLGGGGSLDSANDL